MSVTAKEILRLVKEKSGRTDAEEVCLFGDSARPVSRAVICWMPTPEAIEYTASVKADLIISHEILFFPYQTGFEDSQAALSWTANARRAELLSKYSMTCIRIHQSADELTIYDAFATRLGLANPIPGSEGITRAYNVEPVTYGELIERVKSTGLPVLRCTSGDMNRQIEKIGLPWGGLGLFLNIPHMEKLVEMGCQAFIAGESDSYGHHFARESGVYMIETGHEASENPGLRLMVDWFKKEFPDLEVSFYETPPAYVV